MLFPDDDEPDRPRSFADAIRAATGCHPSDIHRVERLIRDEVGPLDQIHPDLLPDHARRLHRFLLTLRRELEDPDATARVLGISRLEFNAIVRRYLGD